MEFDALQESQKLISIGRLAAEIAHEINNPLESVSNLIYLAKCEPNLPERAAEYLRGAERELGRVIQITNQTLSFSRESDQRVKVHIAELMDEVVSLYGRRLQQKRVRALREYEQVPSITVLPGEIRQVLSNLVTNAIEASSAGGHLRLRIRCGHQWQGRARVRGLRISVSDNGSGIPEPVRERLGEIFFTTKGQSGTGLGLWVTKAVVTRYAGTLRFKSSTGKRHGTVFTLFLPLEQPVGLASGGELPMQTMAGNRQLESSRDHCGNLRQISDHPSHHDNDPGDAGDAHLGRTQRRNA